MPLISILPELKKARKGGYTVPLFDVFEMTGSEDFFAAIAEKKAPGIIALYSGTFDKPDADAFIAALTVMAKKNPQPVSLMLDHGRSFEQCKKALAAGCTDVMFDGSSLPIDENIDITRKVVEAAHAAGAGVEAELGHVGSGGAYQDYGAKRKGFTDPEAVERFIAETDVDMLAIAVGTAHGKYQGEPSIDLELLAAIREKTDIPLVLHGGSGLSEEQFVAAIKTGISKINIATDILKAGEQKLIQAVHHPDKEAYLHIFHIMKELHQGFKDRFGYYFDLFGATGKA